MSNSRLTTSTDGRQSPEEASALEKHIRYFGENGINYDSVKAKLMQLGEPDQEASSAANLTSFTGGLVIKKCPYRMFQAREAVGTLNHAKNTGIFKADGSIDEDRWNELCKYSEIDQDVKIITEARLYEFRQWCHDNDKRWDWFGAGEKTSDIEWENFFRFITDHWKTTGDKSERCVKLETLRTFFENSPAVFDKVVEKQLPVPKPK